MNQFFQCFCINRFGLGPLHYVSSRSNLASNSRRYLYSKIDSPRRGVDKIAWSIHFFKPLNNSFVIVHFLPNWSFKGMVYRLIKAPKIHTRLLFSLNSDSPYHRSAESSTPWLNDTRSRRLSVSVIREVGDSPTQRYRESTTHCITGARSRRLSVSLIQRVFF
jgi:hypothetical protein